MYFFIQQRKDFVVKDYVWISLNLKVNKSSQFFSVLTILVWEHVAITKFLIVIGHLCAYFLVIGAQLHGCPIIAMQL